ncbi:MAG TPA: ABC transporter substrate-binding protein [Acidimicrobiia bacterium]|nr:ABC transporter substrate-binding protein [Acidimicrobiia bacterium]
MGLRTRFRPGTRRHATVAFAIAIVVSALGFGGSALAAPASAPAAKFTGDPVKVATMGEFDVPSAGTSNPEWPGAVQARAKAINKAGGLKDASGKTHELQVIVCNSALDPNKATQCANDAVAQKVVAVIGINSSEAPQMMPILTAANIPVIAPVVVDPSETTSKNSFPITSGVPGAFIAMPQILAKTGATKISLIYPDIPGAATAKLFVNAGIKKAGVQDGGAVPVAADATDLTPAIAAATKEGTNGIAAFLLGDAQGTLLRQIKQQGVKAKLSTASAFLTPSLLSSRGDTTNGVLVVGSTVPITTKTKGGQMFQKDMNAFNKKLAQTDLAAQNWLGAWVFERVANTLPAITAASVLDAMGKLQNMDMGGLTPPLTTTTPFNSPDNPSYNALLARLYNPTVVYERVKNGKVFLVGDKKNPFVTVF